MLCRLDMLFCTTTTAPVYLVLLLVLSTTTTFTFRVDHRSVANILASSVGQTQDGLRPPLNLNGIGEEEWGRQESNPWLTFDPLELGYGNVEDMVGAEGRDKRASGATTASDVTLNNQARLKNYIRKVNEYFALIGRPRWVPSRTRITEF